MTASAFRPFPPGSLAKSHWEIVDTWNGGTNVPKTVFTSEAPGTKGENECFVWILRHTSFSYHEATTRQGYRVRPVTPA